MSTTPIYLDYAATTPVDPAVAAAMVEALGAEGAFGNASAVTHVFGRRAEAQVEAARTQVAALIGARSNEIVFTSGATESNNLAILGIARAAAIPAKGARHVVTSKIEHKAVLDVCKQLEREGFAVTYVAPDSAGRVQPEAIRAALRPDTVLVSVMHANNEIGVIQSVESIGAICRERGIPFHVDAAQSVGKMRVDVGSLPVDLLSFTAHKIYGPKGIGALYVRSAMRAALKPVTFGGGQERGIRPGTLPTHQIVGLGRACELASAALASEPARIAALRDRLWEHLRRIEGVHLNGGDAPRLPGILNVSFEGVEGESLVTSLTSLALSTGSACSSASGDPSYVLRALGRNTALAQSSLRFSFGRMSSTSDIDQAAVAVERQVTRLREASPAGSGEAPPPLQIPDSERQAPLHAALSAKTRQYFDDLAGVGRMVPGPGVAQGEAGGPGAEAWVRFHLHVARREADYPIVRAALFQAWGCPHTLAVTSWLTAQLAGRQLSSEDEFVPGTPSAWLQAFEVPVEKLGRLLVIEDALRAAFRHGRQGF
jgi:cysteine desulfurase